MLRWGRFAHVAGLHLLKVFGSIQQINSLHSLGQAPAMMSLLSLPRLDGPLGCGKRSQHIWTEVSLSHRFRRSVKMLQISLSRRDHCARLTCNLSLWATSFLSLARVFGRGQGLNIQKVKGHRKTKQECAIKVTAYLN